jgi:uncharacterized protein (TIGR00251 family)
MPLSVKYCKDGIQFPAIVQPRSSKNIICGLQGDSLKIRLTAPPVDGAANKMCVKLLAKILGINLSKITITKGQKGRNKIFLIKGITESEFFKKIPLFN